MTWTRLADTSVNETGLINLPNVSALGVTGGYSPAKRVFVIGSGSRVYKLDQNGQWTTMVAAPVSLGVNETSFGVDPVSGNFLVMANGQSTMRQFNPDGTGTWSTVSTTVPANIRALSGPGDGLVTAAITTYGVVMYVKYTGSNTVTYLYRHTAGTMPPEDTVPPAEPNQLRLSSVDSLKESLAR
jgi:hypothetical protein